LFQSGADSCILRASLFSNPEFHPFVPGLGFKCFRDNDVSANFVTLADIDGQGENWDFFAKKQTNILPFAKQSFVVRFLEKISTGRESQCPKWISVKQFAESDEYGNERESNVANSNFPHSR
jgi:hypothetical protein